MPDEQKKILPIDYTNREFNTIRRDLYGSWLGNKLIKNED